MYLIIIAIVIQALGLVTAFAPNALSIGHSPSWVNISAPILDLYVEMFSTSDLYGDIWRKLIVQLEEELPEDNWSVPLDCGEACFFTIQYDAPALSCRDLSPDEYTVTAYDSSASNTSWTFYQFDDTTLNNELEWTANNPPFIFNYVPMSFKSNPSTMVSTGSPTGSICQCKDGTYEAAFLYSNNTIKFIDFEDTALLSDGYANNCTNMDTSAECSNYRDNAYQICVGFTQSLSGSMVLDLVTGRTSGGKSPLVVEKFANYSLNYVDDGITYFEPRYANLSEALPLFFANLTLGLLPGLGQIANITGEVSNNDQKWDYSAIALFATYIPALAVVLPIAAYGLYCIHANGRAMDSKFSTVLLTTRNVEIDGVYDKADNFDELMGKKLVYAKRGCFVPGPSQNLAKED
jgi:hypothetical protein